MIKRFLCLVSICICIIGLTSCDFFQSKDTEEPNKLQTVSLVASEATKPSFDAYSKIKNENGNGYYKFYYFNVGSVEGVPIVWDTPEQKTDLYDLEISYSITEAKEDGIEESISSALEHSTSTNYTEGLVITKGQQNSITKTIDFSVEEGASIGGSITSTLGTKVGTEAEANVFFTNTKVSSEVNAEVSKTISGEVSLNATEAWGKEFSNSNSVEAANSAERAAGSSKSSTIQNAYSSYKNSSISKTKTSTYKVKSDAPNGFYRYAMFNACQVYMILVIDEVNNTAYYKYNMYPIKDSYYYGIQYSKDFSFDDDANKKISVDLKDVVQYLNYDCDSSLSSDNTYTITFNSNGGTSVKSQNIKSGGKVSQPSNPTKTGYIFGGWYTESSLINRYNFNDFVGKNLTLYAKWISTTTETTKYRVSFNSEGGTSVSSKSVSKGGTISAPSAPTRSGCIFDGWYTSYTYTTKFDFSTKVNSDITLYAKWILNSSHQLGLTSNSKIWNDGVSIYANLTNDTGFDIYYLENTNMEVYNKSTGYLCASALFGDVKPNNYIKNGTTLNKWDFFFDTTCCDLSYWQNNSFSYRVSFGYDCVVLPNELK